MTFHLRRRRLRVLIVEDFGNRNFHTAACTGGSHEYHILLVPELYDLRNEGKNQAEGVSIADTVSEMA